MSFSSEQKKEIIKQGIKNACCRRAFMQGVLVGADVSEGGIILSFESRETAEFISELIKEIYSTDAEAVSSPKGGRRRMLAFSSASAVKFVRSFVGGEYFYRRKCSCCESAFMRGLFLSSGRVSDPSKQYSLEFSLRGATEMGSFFFESLGMTPRISKKPNEVLIYFKNSEAIEEFFVRAGMNGTAFAFMNAKIQGEFRNNANRIANCETNNIDKAVCASMELISVLEELDRRGLLSQLPDELEDTARARMENKHLSLSQLASMLTPPITKSGLSHRLKRISDIAEILLKRKTD